MKERHTATQGKGQIYLKIRKICFFVEVYEKLVSLIVGSYYVSFKQNYTVPSYSQDIAKTRENISKNLKCKHFNFHTMHFILVEWAELGKIDEPIETPTFDMLKEKSLGCLSNILFWNDQQKHVSSRIEKMEHTLLMGDYGTGDIFYLKRVIIVGFKFKFKIKSQTVSNFTNIIC